MQRRSQTRKTGVGEIELLDTTGAVVARGSLRNVSERGLGVSHLEPVGERVFTKGDELAVRLLMPVGPIQTDARIQWINGGALGLKMRPDETNAAKVARFLEGLGDAATH